MQLPRRKARVVLDTLAAWERDGTFSPSESVRLSGSVEVLAFDWQRLARLSFWFAVTCIAVAVGSVLADDALMRVLRTLCGAPAAVKSAGLAVLAAALYAAGLRRRRAHPERRYGIEAVLFLGVLATAGAIGFLGAALDTGSGRISALLLLAALVYAALGFLFPSTLVWVFALLSLGSWLGTETGDAVPAGERGRRGGGRVGGAAHPRRNAPGYQPPRETGPALSTNRREEARSRCHEPS